MGNSGPEEPVRGIVEDVVGKAKEIIGIIANRDGLREEGRAQQDKAKAARDVAKKEAEAEPPAPPRRPPRLARRQQVTESPGRQWLLPLPPSLYICLWRQHDPRRVAGVLPHRRDIAQRHRAGVDAQSPIADRLGDRGQIGQDVAGRHRTLPLPTICSGSARNAADGISAVAPATEPISIQVSGRALSRRCVAIVVIASAVTWPHR